MPAMVADDRVSNGQPQTGTFTNWLGGKKWIQDTVAQGFWNAVARIGYADNVFATLSTGGDRNGALTLDRVDRIRDQVHHGLVQQCGKALNEIRLAKL